MQIHDYNPGYMGGWPSGVFWTKASPASGMSADLVAGTAFYKETDLDIADYSNFTNAFANGPTFPARVSFDTRWFPGPQSRRWIYNHPANSQEPDSYALDYWDTICTLEWEARNADGFSFSSYKIGQYPAGRKPGQLFAVAGRERSGAFYSPFSADETGSPNAPGSAGGSVDRRLADTGPGISSSLGGTLLLGGAAMLLRARRRSTQADDSKEARNA